jgi:hypothetical protein
MLGVVDHKTAQRTKKWIQSNRNSNVTWEFHVPENSDLPDLGTIQCVKFEEIQLHKRLRNNRYFLKLFYLHTYPTKFCSIPNFYVFIWDRNNGRSVSVNCKSILFIMHHRICHELK